MTDVFYSKRAADQILRLLQGREHSLLLDVGSGPGLHSKYFEEKGDTIEAVALDPYSNHPADVRVPFMDYEEKGYDVVWMSHVLEHQPNVHDFLDHARKRLSEGGCLAVTVPPMKPNLVGGHLTLWTPALLCYNLILAGFDCSDAWVCCYGYNISVIVKHTEERLNAVLEVLPQLVYDNGDIETLAEFFPRKWMVRQNMDGSNLDHNC